MMEDFVVNDQQQEMRLRKRGRPKKVRREPPKPSSEPSSEAKQPGQDEAGVSVAGDTKSEAGYVTIRLPIAELTGTGYQVSRDDVPRRILARQLTRKQGTALAMVRLGMLAEETHLDAERVDFYSGGKRAIKVSSKEEVVARILEHIAHAIEEKK